MYGTLEDRTGSEADSQAGATSQRGQTLDVESIAGESKRIYSHCHVQNDDNQERNGIDKGARKRLIAASIICLLFMIGEVIGGVVSNSLAIATDAAHLLTDFASFMISLFAIWLSSRPATRNMSFGWYRAEVIGALASVLMIWLVTGFLNFMAVERLRTQEFEIDSVIMVITASAGLLVNIVLAVALHDNHGHSHGHGHCHRLEEETDHHGHQHSQEHLCETSCDQSRLQSVSATIANESDSHLIEINPKSNLLLDRLQQVKPQPDQMGSEAGKRSERKVDSNHKTRRNINVRAAFIHVIGDFVQSLGVLIAALVIHFGGKKYAIVDPICTFLFSIVVLVTTLNIIRDAVNVLMEGIPEGINFIEVRGKLQKIPGVIRVHNLRIWSLSMDKIAISSHLVIDNSRTPSEALKQAIDTLKSSYNFFEITIQVEEYREDMKDCEHCQDEKVVVARQEEVIIK